MVFVSIPNIVALGILSNCTHSWMLALIDLLVLAFGIVGQIERLSIVTHSDPSL